jgi:hypothetical protein
MERLTKYVNAKQFSMPPQKFGAPLLLFTVVYCPREVFGALPVEEHAGFPLDDRLNGAAGSKRNGWPTCSGHFDRNHTKVFFTRKE